MFRASTAGSESQNASSYDRVVDGASVNNVKRVFLKSLHARERMLVADPFEGGRSLKRFTTGVFPIG